MSTSRAFVSIFSNSLVETRDFYLAIFDYKVEFDSDWFIHLQAENNAGLELGIMRRDHELVPHDFQLAPQGILLTIVVENVDAIYTRCQQLAVAIIEPPTDQFYGQRRMLIQDPSGTLLDVSSECAPSAEFLQSMNAG